MNKIYQKMYLQNKNRFQGVLSRFIDNVILRSFYSEFRPCKNAKWPGCRAKTPRHDNNIHDVVLRGCNSGSHPYFAKRAGFTLIELLVVVLVIGILAAIALPQYNRAVEKSRAAEAISIMRSLYNAKLLYYMSNGVWPEKISSLDWSYAGLQQSTADGQEYFFTNHFHCRSWGACKPLGEKRTIDYYIGLRPLNGNPAEGQWRCCFKNGDEKAENFCRGLWPDGVFIQSTSMWYDNERCIVTDL